jgi:hypothetical protein
MWKTDTSGLISEFWPLKKWLKNWDTLTWNLYIDENSIKIFWDDSNGRKYEDSTYAKTCNNYKNPVAWYKYEGDTWNWVYWIAPTGSNKLKVYCDMTTDWGWWTIVYNQVWDDNEKMVWQLDTTTWTAWAKSEHRIDPSLIYTWEDKLELLIMQDSRWIKLKDINKKSFDNIFNDDWTHSENLAISNSSTWIWSRLMDQDNYSTWEWVYQWNIAGKTKEDESTCFEYTKNGWTNEVHEWIVFPKCEWQNSKESWVLYPRRWIVWIR